MSPGGTAAFLVKHYKGKDAAEVDIRILAELRAHEKQAAEELGQWSEKRDLTSDGTEALNSITVTFVDSPSIAAERETAKLLALAAKTK